MTSVSFDYELCWGTYEMVDAGYLRSHVAGANEAATRVLALHESASVPATWAMTGAAADHRSLEDRLRICRSLGAPVHLLERQLASLSPAEAIEVSTIPMAFLHALARSTRQSAGLHSYSHQYPPAMSQDALQTDLRLCAEVLAQYGLNADFAVAPKNLATKEWAKQVHKVGVSSIRVNPRNSLYRSEGSRIPARFVRLLRQADAFIPLSERLNSGPDSDLSVPAPVVGNFFLRIGLPRRLFALHIRRLRWWLEYCSSTRTSAHLWCHPHNFGADVDLALRRYEDVLDLLQSSGSLREDDR